MAALCRRVGRPECATARSQAVTSRLASDIPRRCAHDHHHVTGLHHVFGPPLQARGECLGELSEGAVLAGQDQPGQVDGRIAVPMDQAVGQASS